MFPTIDNVEEYLRSKQWDKLLKEYQKYKTTIMDSNESNIVIEMVIIWFLWFIDRLKHIWWVIFRRLLMNYCHYYIIQAVCWHLNSRHILLMLWLDWIILMFLSCLWSKIVFKHGRIQSSFIRSNFWSIIDEMKWLDSTCELERIDLHEVSNESSRRVAVGLLLQYMRDLSSKYLEILKKCMNVLCVWLNWYYQE